jgi:hypothetical protein
MITPSDHHQQFRRGEQLGLTGRAGCRARLRRAWNVAMLYAYSLLQPPTAARVRTVFPVLGSPAGRAAGATVCAMLLQALARGDNLILADQFRNWPEELRRCCP